MIETIFGVLALIPVGYFVWDRYIAKGHEFDFGAKNTTFALFEDPGHKMHGCLGVVFYDLKIVNASNSPFTMKKVLIAFRIHGKKHTTDSFVLRTSTLPNGKPATVVRVGANHVVLIGWENLRSQIGEHQLLQPGGVLSSSAFFLLDGLAVRALDDLKRFKIILKDYRGRKTTKVVDIEESWKENLRNGARIVNKPFSVDDAGNVSFA